MKVAIIEKEAAVTEPAASQQWQPAGAKIKQL
jgi:hypothetical protein